MVEKIMACGPNISEGNDISVIKKILAGVEKNSKIKLLSVHSFKKYNRTKILFMGEPEDVRKASINLVKRACDSIDMRNHKGEHPRVGVVDVLPFIPFKNVNLDECVDMAHKVGERIAKKQKMPIFFYGAAAKKEEYKDLRFFRHNDYEKLKDAEIVADFGNKDFNEKNGAIIIGARYHHISFNIILNTSNLQIADQAAKSLRESGFDKQDGTHVDGKIKGVCAAAYKSKDNSASISLVIKDPNIAKLHHVYIDFKKYLDNLNYDIVRSEMTGFFLKEDLLNAGKFFMKLRNKKLENEKDILNLFMGEMKVCEFDFAKKMIDF